jgi:hypothetical protein
MPAKLAVNVLDGTHELRQDDHDRAMSQHTGVPARRVVYGSLKARAARVVVGLIFAGLTLLIILPVVPGEHAPPTPTGLFVGMNINKPTTPAAPESLMDLQIHSESCRNPVTIEGRLLPSARTWYLGARHEYETESTPTQAELTLANARLLRADVGFGGQESAYYAPIVGYFGEPLIERTATFQTTDERPATIQASLSRILAGGRRGPPASGVVFTARDWPALRLPLHFILKADIAYPLGYHKCYIDVPELFAAGAQAERSAFSEAERLTEKPGMGSPAFAERVGQPALGVAQQDLAAADVYVSVANYIPELSSLGTGTHVRNSVEYQCQTYLSKPKLPPNVESRMLRTEPRAENQEPGASAYYPDTNSNCSGTPVFEAVGVGADVTRRVLAAGILGALAATLIIEALFVGETESRKPKDATAGNP